MSFAHAIREVSWEGSLSHESQQSAVASRHAACPPTACPSVAASRRLPTFPIARAVTAGPPLALDWKSGRPRALSGDLIAPLSLATSVAIPPVVAFRTAALKDCMARCNCAIPLFVERTILADVASLGEIVFEPYVAGVFRAHAQQGFRVMQSEDAGALAQQWLQMAQQLNAIVKRQNGAWRHSLVNLISEISPDHRRNWERESRSWPEDISLCREMRAALLTKPAPERIPLSPSGLYRAGARAARSLISRVLS